MLGAVSEKQGRAECRLFILLLPSPVSPRLPVLLTVSRGMQNGPQVL